MMPKKSNFMIVDDQDVVRNSVKSQLLEIGFSGEIHTAENGVEALKYLQENKDFDFIICDIVMPEMTGTELLKKVREIPEYMNTPFLLLTVQSDIKIVMEAIVGGASNYLVKPWIIEDLKTKIVLCWQKHHGQSDDS